MLGERLTTLLSLISQDEYKTVDEFAQKMSLSTKTVRGLLQELNEQLQTHGAEVLHERGKGYRLKVQDLDKFQTIFLKADSNIPQDSRGRVRFLIEYFLKDDCYTKVETLCEKLYVSRKTLTSDLRQAEDFFNRFQLTLERTMECGWWEMSSTRGSAFPNIYRNGTLAWSTQHWKKTRRNTNLHRCWWNFWNRKTITSRMWG